MTTPWGPALDAEVRYRRTEMQAAWLRRRAARPRRSHTRRPTPAGATAVTVAATGRR